MRGRLWTKKLKCLRVIVSYRYHPLLGTCLEFSAVHCSYTRSVATRYQVDERYKWLCKAISYRWTKTDTCVLFVCLCIKLHCVRHLIQYKINGTNEQISCVATPKNWRTHKNLKPCFCVSSTVFGVAIQESNRIFDYSFRLTWLPVVERLCCCVMYI